MIGIEFDGDFLHLILELGLKFAAAIICGAAVGIERESSGKPAGLRTNILICLGAMLFTVMSFKIAGEARGDAARVAAQIVTGIGFLGAGAILHESRRGVTGMTTAALIWFTAALGMMIGAGFIVTAVAVAGLTTLSMIGLKRVERFINERQGSDYSFTLNDDAPSRERLERLINVFDSGLRDVAIVPDLANRICVTLHFTGSANERHELLQELFAIEGIRKKRST